MGCLEPGVASRMVVPALCGEQCNLIYHKENNNHDNKIVTVIYLYRKSVE